MTFLPIVTRELRVRSRSRAAYWWRCAAALVAAAMAGVMMMAGLVISPGRVGKAMFAAMAWVAWIFCLAEGLRQTADCLSEEKREGTFGLLFLSDLKGYDVVLGKWISRLVAAFFPLLAALPLLGLSLLHGGVTAGEFWRMCLALANTLFFTLSASLFVSAVSREERRAWLGSILLTGLFVVGLPLADDLNRALGGLPYLLSPYAPFRLAFEAEYVRDRARFWGATAAVHLLGWGWLGLASLLLPRCWQEKVSDGSAGGRGLRRAGAAATAARAGAQAHLRSTNPSLWLGLRGLGGGRVAWLITIAASLCGFLLGFGASLATQPPAWMGLGLAAFGLHLLLSLAVAWEAAHSFSRLRQTGLLETLLATPLSAAEIVAGQASALRRTFMGPVLVLAGTELTVALLLTLTGLFQRGAVDVGMAVVVWLVLGSAIGLWLLDLVTVARVGMWLSLTARKPAQAWAKTVLWVMIAPLLGLIPTAGFCCFPPAALYLLIIKDLLFVQWANGNLRDRFREVAAQSPNRA